MRRASASEAFEEVQEAIEFEFSEANKYGTVAASSVDGI